MMYKVVLTYLLVNIFILCYGSKNIRYNPNWDSLDKRPLPQWYDDVKFGIFIHWGVYSVPSFGSEWFWINWKGSNSTSINNFMNSNYPPGFSYQDFAKDFTAEFFDPDEWADLFDKSGAKYVVLTSKHHEGYALWPSKYSFSWNSMDVGPHKDLIGMLANSIKNRTNIHFGLYHSLFEWFNPIYLSDKNTNFTSRDFVDHKIMPEMIELIENYKPDVLWSDGEWEALDTYWRATEFLAWLFNDSPVKDKVVVNDRWGMGTLCKHGDFYTCQDRYNPGVLQTHKWENAMTIDKKSWGFRRNANISSYFTTGELIKELVITVSCGGNILMNIGPTKDGIIAPIFQDRLTNVGKWLRINGDAIYKSKPYLYQNDTVGQTWYTQRPDKKTVYAIFLEWPVSGELQLNVSKSLFKDTTTVNLLGYSDTKPMQWRAENSLILVSLPKRQLVTVEWAWVLQINLTENKKHVN